MTIEEVRAIIEEESGSLGACGYSDYSDAVLDLLTVLECAIAWDVTRTVEYETSEGRTLSRVLRGYSV